MTLYDKVTIDPSTGFQPCSLFVKDLERIVRLARRATREHPENPRHVSVFCVNVGNAVGDPVTTTAEILLGKEFGGYGRDRQFLLGYLEECDGAEAERCVKELCGLLVGVLPLDTHYGVASLTAPPYRDASELVKEVEEALQK